MELLLQADSTAHERPTPPPLVRTTLSTEQAGVELEVLSDPRPTRPMVWGEGGMGRVGRGQTGIS